MKKLIISLSFLTITSTSLLSYAETGTISFSGTLTTATCTATAPGSTGSTINVPMGTVSIADLSDGTTGQAGATAHVIVDINCTNATGLNNVIMRFHPRSGTGLDANDNRLLKTTGSGGGVGIALLNSSDMILNLGSGDTLSAPMTVNAGSATAKLDLRAAYIKNTKPVVAGPANATMPFTFIYD